MFPGMLVGQLAASLLGNMLAGEGVLRGDDGLNQAVKGMIRAG